MKRRCLLASLSKAKVGTLAFRWRAVVRVSPEEAQRDGFKQVRNALADSRLR